MKKLVNNKLLILFSLSDLKYYKNNINTFRSFNYKILCLDTSIISFLKDFVLPNIELLFWYDVGREFELYSKEINSKFFNDLNLYKNAKEDYLLWQRYTYEFNCSKLINFFNTKKFDKILLIKDNSIIIDNRGHFKSDFKYTLLNKLYIANCDVKLFNSLNSFNMIVKNYLVNTNKKLLRYFILSLLDILFIFKLRFNFLIIGNGINLDLPIKYRSIYIFFDKFPFLKRNFLFRSIMGLFIFDNSNSSLLHSSDELKLTLEEYNLKNKSLEFKFRKELFKLVKKLENFKISHIYISDNFTYSSWFFCKHFYQNKFSDFLLLSHGNYRRDSLWRYFFENINKYSDHNKKVNMNISNIDIEKEDLHFKGKLLISLYSYSYSKNGILKFNPLLLDKYLSIFESNEIDFKLNINRKKNSEPLRFYDDITRFNCNIINDFSSFNNFQIQYLSVGHWGQIHTKLLFQKKEIFFIGHDINQIPHKIKKINLIFYKSLNLEYSDLNIYKIYNS